MDVSSFSSCNQNRGHTEAVFKAAINHYLIACDVAELVDGDVLVQVGPHDNRVAVAGRLQDPDLLLLQGLAVGVGPEAEGFGGQVLVLAVDEADRPAASLRRGRTVRSIGGVDSIVDQRSGHGGNCNDNMSGTN